MRTILTILIGTVLVMSYEYFTGISVAMQPISVLARAGHFMIIMVFGFILVGSSD